MIVITKLYFIEERASPSLALVWRSEAVREGHRGNGAIPDQDLKWHRWADRARRRDQPDLYIIYPLRPLVCS